MACLPDCRPAVRLVSTMAKAVVFSHKKLITSDYETVVPKNVYSLRHGAFFYPLLVSFRQSA